jgi:hypothetical protein
MKRYYKLSKVQAPQLLTRIEKFIVSGNSFKVTFMCLFRAWRRTQISWLQWKAKRQLCHLVKDLKTMKYLTRRCHVSQLKVRVSSTKVTRENTSCKLSMIVRSTFVLKMRSLATICAILSLSKVINSITIPSMTHLVLAPALYFE